MDRWTEAPVSRPATPLDVQEAWHQVGLRLWITPLGLILVILLGWLRAHLDLRLEGSRIAYGQLPVGPLALLAVLVWAVSPPLNKLKRTLRAGEIALLFSIILATTRFWSSSYAVLPLSLAVAPFYYANPTNNYELLHPLFPQALVPRDKLAIKAFYEGSPSGQVPWEEWIGPLLIWTVSTGFLLIALGGLTVFFYERWADREKLIFPIARVALEMIRQPEPIWTRRAFWVGAIASFSVHSWNGLSHYYAPIPFLNIRSLINMNALFTDRPWAIVSYESAPVGIYPSVVGTTYLIPAEVALGFWLFHLLSYVEMVILFGLGLPPGGYDYGGIRAITRSHEIGAFFVLGAALAYRTWESQQATKENVKTGPGLMLFLIGFFGLVVLWTWLGAHWSASLGYFLLYFIVSIVLARISCQAGCIFIGMDFHPHNVSGYLFGQMSPGLKNLVVMMFPHMAYMMERDVVPLPYFLNAAHIVSSSKASQGLFLLYAFWSGLLGGLLSLFFSLMVIYRYGGLNLHYHYLTRLSRWAWDKYLGWFRSPSPPDTRATVGIAAGMAFTSLLILCQNRIPGFPIHPLGIALADSLVIRRIWLSLFLGWAIKRFVLRYLGLALYYALLPAFIGLVVGELLTATIWLGIDHLFQKRGHDVFPGFPPL